MNLINEVWTALEYQQLQQEAAQHAWDGEYRDAVLKMIGCYYELDCEGLEAALQRHVIPRWLIDPVSHKFGTVKAIGKAETRHILSMSGGGGVVAGEILAGDFGAAVLTMSGLYYGQLIEKMDPDINQIDAMCVSNVRHPWDDLSELMLQPSLTFEEIVEKDMNKAYAW
jgi:hypothetical protein